MSVINCMKDKLPSVSNTTQYLPFQDFTSVSNMIQSKFVTHKKVSGMMVPPQLALLFQYLD